MKVYRREHATLTACRKSLGHRDAGRAADDAGADDRNSRANPSALQRSPGVLRRNPSVLRLCAIRVVRPRVMLPTGGQRGAAPGPGPCAPRTRSAQGRRA
jgi:hypothetical protein